MLAVGGKGQWFSRAVPSVLDSLGHVRRAKAERFAGAARAWTVRLPPAGTSGSGMDCRLAEVVEWLRWRPGHPSPPPPSSARPADPQQRCCGPHVLFFTAPSLLAPLSGLLADRVRRRPLLVVTNIATGSAVLLLFFVHDSGQVWLVHLVMALYGLPYSVPGSAQSALLTVMVPAGAVTGSSLPCPWSLYPGDPAAQEQAGAWAAGAVLDVRSRPSRQSGRSIAASVSASPGNAESRLGPTKEQTK